MFAQSLTAGVWGNIVLKSPKSLIKKTWLVLTCIFQRIRKKYLYFSKSMDIHHDKLIRVGSFYIEILNLVHTDSLKYLVVIWKGNCVIKTIISWG